MLTKESCLLRLVYFEILFLFFSVEYLISSSYNLQVRSYMEKNGIEVRDYGEVSSDATLLASDQLFSSNATKENAHDTPKNANDSSGKPGTVGSDNSAGEGSRNDLVWVDPGSCCYALYSRLKLDRLFLQSSPLALAKALKVCFLGKA